MSLLLDIGTSLGRSRAWRNDFMMYFTVAEFWPSLATLSLGFPCSVNDPSFCTMNTGSGTTLSSLTTALRPQPVASKAAVNKRSMVRLICVLLLSQ